MSTIEGLIILTNIAFVSLTVLWDIRTHKIPNAIVIILLLINLSSFFYFNLFINSNEADIGRILFLLSESAFCFFFLYPFFSIGAIGAGDIKLIISTSLVCKDPLLFSFEVFVIAAVISLIRMGVKKNANFRFEYLLSYISNSFHNKLFTLYENAPMVSSRTEHSVHLSLPVLLALLCYYLFHIV